MDERRVSPGSLRSRSWRAPERIGYSIDSRTMHHGDLFFAVSGDRFDGQILSSRHRGGRNRGSRLPGSKADDSKAAEIRKRFSGRRSTSAMQRLASSVRRHWGKRVIGITGSAGKTTTKEAIAQVLEADFGSISPEGNLNNHYGLPLQLLRLQPEHEIAILEMGMSHAGEIAALCKIAAPDWGVVTNVGTAHGENFTDGQAGLPAPNMN